MFAFMPVVETPELQGLCVVDLMWLVRDTTDINDCQRIISRQLPARHCLQHL